MLFPHWSLVESKSNCSLPGRASSRWWGTRGWGMRISCIFHHSCHHGTSLLWSLLFRLELGRHIWVHWSLRKLHWKFCVQVLSSHASHGGAVLQARRLFSWRNVQKPSAALGYFLGPIPDPLWCVCSLSGSCLLQGGLPSSCRDPCVRGHGASILPDL